MEEVLYQCRPLYAANVWSVAMHPDSLMCKGPYLTKDLYLYLNSPDFFFRFLQFTKPCLAGQETCCIFVTLTGIVLPPICD